MRYIAFFLGLIFFGIFLVLMPLVIANKLNPCYSFCYLLLFAPIGFFTGAFIAEEIERNS